MRYELSRFCLALLLVAGVAGCTGSDETKQLADELDKALDPAPDYVDEPADKPREPQ
jgi:hypothetical protein